MNIKRQLPTTIEENYTAIFNAKVRKDNPPPYGNILSDATSLLIDNLIVSLKAARADIF